LAERRERIRGEQRGGLRYAVSKREGILRLLEKKGGDS